MRGIEFGIEGPEVMFAVVVWECDITEFLPSFQFVFLDSIGVRGGFRILCGGGSLGVNSKGLTPFLLSNASFALLCPAHTGCVAMHQEK